MQTLAPSSDRLADQWRPQRVAIIGIGLLGGSVGLAVRRAWPDATIIGYARRQETLEAALRAGAATEATIDLTKAVDSVDLICVGTPVTLIGQHVLSISQICSADAVITDVGSTKASIVAQVERNSNAAKKFVGSHPIAGGEKTGPQFAREDLFDDRLVVLTPTPATDPERLAKIEFLWSALGARISKTTPEHHDEVLAATSHLPHLVAASLASIIPPHAIEFAGPGWRDTTRVAGGCPEMWSAICKENQVAIVAQLTRMIGCLEDLRDAVSANDSEAIRSLLVQAREKRARVDDLQNRSDGTVGDGTVDDGNE